MINPKRLEKGPIKMLLIGIIYASLSILLVKAFFSSDTILYNYAGIIVVTFSVMFSLPFMYYLIKKEEWMDEHAEGFFGVWRIHKEALFSLMWLFLGFLIAFSFWYIFLQDQTLFNAQIQTYCAINHPGDVSGCLSSYSIQGEHVTGGAIKELKLLSVISNNLYVMLFTLLFSLIFGAGAIFVLAWNASVIAAAIGIFTRYQIDQIPLGIARYMIHGFPEIAAYFLTALAGGIFGVGFLRHGIKDKMFIRVSENTALLLFMAVLILILAALIEVYLTPLIFG